MEKEKISMKGGKYPQDFQEKLMTLSLNVQNAINKGQKKKAKVHLELIRVQHSIKNQTKN